MAQPTLDDVEHLLACAFSEHGVEATMWAVHRAVRHRASANDTSSMQWQRESQRCRLLAEHVAAGTGIYAKRRSEED
jgi:hypothetical protein